MYVLADNRTAQKPKVSIMMPCYNHGKYVADAIKSVLNQTYQDYEFIVLENGSSDNSREVILQYQDKIDLIFGVDANSYFSMFGVKEHCRGDYIAIMFSDDFWEPEKLEKQMAAIRKYKVDFCFTQALYTAEDLNDEIKGSREIFNVPNMKREKWIRYFFEHGNCLSYPSLVYARRYIEMIMDIIPYKQLPDYDRWMHVLLETDIYVLPEALVRMRRHSQCVSASTKKVSVRTINEKSYIDLEILEKMPGELFAGAYEGVFPFMAEGEDDLLAQKILVAVSYAQTDIEWHMIAMAMFYKYYSTGNVAKVLGEKYGVQFEELHEIFGKMGAGAWVYEIENLKKQICIQNEGVNEPLARRNAVGVMENISAYFQKWKELLEKVLKLEACGTVDWNHRRIVADHLVDFLKYLRCLRGGGVLENAQELDKLGEAFRYSGEGILNMECWETVLECKDVLEKILERSAPPA